MENERDNHVFEELSSELSGDEREALLSRLKGKKSASGSGAITEKELSYQLAEYNITIPSRLKSEPAVYKLLLKIRSLVGKETIEKIYTDDVLARIAKQVNLDYPGYIDFRMLRLGESCYFKLRRLKDASDFFKPYFKRYKAHPEDFYGELCQKLLPDFYVTLEDAVSPCHFAGLESVSTENKNKIKIQLEHTLSSMDDKSKEILYSGIKSIKWLYAFTELPLAQLCAEFTNIDGSVFTCPFSHAYQIYEQMAPIFIEHHIVKNELLSALYAFENPSENDAYDPMDLLPVEDTGSSDFMIKAVEKLVEIRTFAKGINVYKIGKVINLDYNWAPEKPEEDDDNWIIVFYDYWKKKLEDNWTKWLLSARASTLLKSMNNDFKIASLPVIENRPWEEMGPNVKFLYKYSGGFIFWFFEKLYGKILPVLDEIQTEGDFRNLINRNEYSSCFCQVNQLAIDIENLNNDLKSSGKYGRIFFEAVSNGETMNMNGTAVDAMMEIEEAVSFCCDQFTQSVDIYCRLLQAIMSNSTTAPYEGLLNLDVIKGNYNKEWKKSLAKAYNILVRCYNYLRELRNLDNL